MIVSKEKSLNRTFNLFQYIYLKINKIEKFLIFFSFLFQFFLDFV